MQYQDKHRSRHSKKEDTSYSRQIRRLAMNGSQPCLMVATPGVSASADIHLHHPRDRDESRNIPMDPNFETNTAKYIPIGGGVTSSMDGFLSRPFEQPFYHTGDTANAQTTLHSKRGSPQKAVSSATVRQQSLPRTGQQINVFHNGTTHHHYFPPHIQGVAPSDTREYQEYPPRPQSSAAVQYQQSLYGDQPYMVDPYFQVGDPRDAHGFRVCTKVL